MFSGVLGAAGSPGLVSSYAPVMDFLSAGVMVRGYGRNLNKRSNFFFVPTKVPQ
jgi:hypothetical protein